MNAFSDRWLAGSAGICDAEIATAARRQPCSDYAAITTSIRRPFDCLSLVSGSQWHNVSVAAEPVRYPNDLFICLFRPEFSSLYTQV